MNHLSYLDTVKTILTEKWSKYTPTPPIKEDDLTAGIGLLTKIAVEAIIKSQFGSESVDHQVVLGAQSLECADKIKGFIEKKAYSFRRICQTGFPFSLLDSSSTATALKCSLEDHDSILSHFMTLKEGWMGEEELNSHFAIPFQRLQTRAIAEACSNLKRAYIENKDNRAGYYLLWLIKRAAGCAYEIPEKDSFDTATVAKVLSQYIQASGSFKNAPHFVEILHYRSSTLENFLYQEFLNSQLWRGFLDLVVEELENTPMDKWPSKPDVITDLLGTLSLTNQLTVAGSLASSTDPATSKIGNHLSAALKAQFLKDAIPHFYSLAELLPNFGASQVQRIFNYPFVEFCRNRSIYKTDPEFTKRLQFNGMRKVFVHDSLMIGVYGIGNDGMPPFLLAYDMNTEKIVWGIPLVPELLEDPSLNVSEVEEPFSRYSLERVGDFLSLQFVGGKKVYFIEPENGELNFTLKLLEVSKDYDCLHISSKGFAYQMINKGQGKRMLIGGKIVDECWQSSFTSEPPGGAFRPFSTHCGFNDAVKQELVLFGPSGRKCTIQHCIAAYACDDRLYSIEEDLLQKENCLLTIRTLKVDEEVVSAVERSIPLNVNYAFFGEFCKNGQLILFAENNTNHDILPVFVDLNSQEVTYSQHPFPSYASHLINPDSGELWTWNSLSKEIWKISPTNSTLMGSMESSNGTTFLHVDKTGRLYFMDNRL